MTRDQIDKIWQQSLHDSVKDGEQFTRYHFANAIIEKCAKVADDRQKQVGDSTNEFSILADKIRALKVKG